MKFVNKPHNDSYYEWGRNCATLRYDLSVTQKCVDDYGGISSSEDSDRFWIGYNDGPRESGEIYSISLINT